ncbi:hypothetical protein THAOC_12471 [Thalassiosira oceanica]|uniref:Uncharacterized protein n=1 Tax=Thalassiosira oceanica TaxID=159749 RepID=K0SMJ8_THAOC|nr:hypothetical protein THAOC_12471 [Thalassiosira oceanica]|eukprot:EJK66600.1 hypothetical protein THAOC_12471 [Thalassiosira oceanica]
MMIEVPDGLESGPLESPRPGDRGEALRTAREGPWREKSSEFDSSLRQKVPFVGKTRPAADHDRVVGAELRRGRRNWTKSSFPESSRRALKLPPIDVFGSSRRSPRCRAHGKRAKNEAQRT